MTTAKNGKAPVSRFSFTSVLAAAGLVAACAAPLPAQAASFHWSGDVDDTATISISGRDVQTSANMKGVRNERRDFRGGGLPNRPIRVTLREADGRGGVRLIQEPNARNGYRAVVRIVDKQSGQNHYDFTLQWNNRRRRMGGRW